MHLFWTIWIGICTVPASDTITMSCSLHFSGRKLSFCVSRVRNIDLFRRNAPTPHKFLCENQERKPRKPTKYRRLHFLKKLFKITSKLKTVSLASPSECFITVCQKQFPVTGKQQITVQSRNVILTFVIKCIGTPVIAVQIVHFLS
jgi:hypothetical protein